MKEMMMLTRRFIPLFSALSLIGLATGFLAISSPELRAQSTTLHGEIAIAGSSTVGPITMAVVENFSELNPSVLVSNAVTGTGGGFKRFTAGETDISNASRPIKPAEVRIAGENGIEFIELPVAFDGLSICVSKDNTWATDLTIDELNKIFSAGSTINNWSQIRDGWPDKELELFTPGTDSGTFDYFKEVVVGDEDFRATGLTVSEDDNVLVQGVAGAEGGLGFFGCAYYFKYKDLLRSVPIVPEEGGDPVKPTPDTIESGEYTPFSRPLFIYVNARAADRPEVAAFVEFYLRTAPRTAEEVGYVQLPRSYYRKAFLEVFGERLTGSIYLDDEGEETGKTLADRFE
ncbi:MAG: PstS family phosphate ABC transporter substrate-binding protein [Planctomycetota bacterium]